MQKLRFSKYVKGLIITLDISVIVVIFLAFLSFQNQTFDLQEILDEHNIIFILILLFYWLLLSGTTKLYLIPRNLTYTSYLQRILSQTLLFIFGILLLARLDNNIFFKTERAWLSLALFSGILIIKSIVFFGIKFLRVRGVNYRNAMFIGKSNDAQKIIEHTLKSRKDYGYRIIDYPKNSINITELIDFWKEQGIHTLFISINDKEFNQNDLEKIKEEALSHHVNIILIPNVLNDSTFNKELTYLETQPILVSAKLPLESFSNYVIKRTFDIIFSFSALILIGSWLFPIIAITIKLTSKGPVFFYQKRYGYKDEVFNCIKFRTMKVNKLSDKEVTKKNDCRITTFGRFLRKTSLDELPQLINVLKGEMSIVGPRPHMLVVDDYYKAKIGRYTARSLAKPGITGLAQVNGLRGDDGDRDIEMKKRILSDVYYVKNWSFILDIVIVLKTLVVLVKGDKKNKLSNYSTKK